MPLELPGAGEEHRKVQGPGLSNLDALGLSRTLLMSDRRKTGRP